MVSGGVWLRCHSTGSSQPNSLGVMYENGFGVKQSYDTALYWYDRDAKRGNWITTMMPSKVFELGKDIGLAAKSRVEKEIARRNRSIGLTPPSDTNDKNDS